MRRLLSIPCLAFCAACFFAPAAAQAEFGFLPGESGFDASVRGEGGEQVASNAGSHPYSVITEFNFRQAGEIPGRPGVPAADGDLRDLHLSLPAGMIENPAALPQCTRAQFQSPRVSPFEVSRSGESCPAETQVGLISVDSSVGGGSVRTFGVFNLSPAPGLLSQLGFAPFGIPITFSPHIRQAEGEYGITLDARNLPQALNIYGLQLTVWGTPWAISHDGQRGNCLNESTPSFPWAKCGVPEAPRAFLTLPPSCSAPVTFSAAADSWQRSGRNRPDGDPDLTDPAWKRASTSAPPLEGCSQLRFEPQAQVLPTSNRATSGTGVDFRLETPQDGLTEPGGLLPSPTKRAVVVLPEGMTVNSSVGAGLGVCTPRQYSTETVASPEGAGCPNASKLGNFFVTTPLLEAPLHGSLYLAEPQQNPFGSLLAVYLIARSAERGILVKLAGEISADPQSGQLVASFDQLPRLPYSRLEVSFREGQRAPLLNPSSCGAYSAAIGLSPWLAPDSSIQQSSGFQVAAGIGGGPCPGSAAPPFTPGASAGTLNGNAGSYSPFYLHLTRGDKEQEITSYSSQLPPGLLGKIAGIPFCPEAALEAASHSSGVDEYEHPSCPAASEIGKTISGYGVGVSLTYAPGRLYLAGPYHGAPLSIVAVDSALVGPFDLGVIIVRSAIKVDRRSAQVSIDSAGSDPIPHILDGIPLHLRDIRVYIDRPEMTVNPTSCAPFSVGSSLSGSRAPFTDPKDIFAAVSVPFQVSNCSSLGFAPKLKLSLKGGTRRGDYPSLRAVVRPHPGDANIGSAAVALPPSEFLAQNHIDTICTKPQFEQRACPSGAVYGRARAVTPLLGEALEGPVYLRSSDNPLPDLVAALHGAGTGIEIDVVGRIDAVHGGLRGSFEGLPDAPVTKFTMVLNGGKRGILVNEKNLCSFTQPASARFIAQNNVGEKLAPVVGAQCKKKGGKHRHHKQTKKRRGRA